MTRKFNVTVAALIAAGASLGACGESKPLAPEPRAAPSVVETTPPPEAPQPVDPVLPAPGLLIETPPEPAPMPPVDPTAEPVDP